MGYKDRQRHSREFKIEAVQRCNESGRSVTEVARELDISAHLLYRWRDLEAKKKENAFPGHGKKNNSDELSRLRRENAQLKQERDILKKTAIYFAKEIPQDLSS